VNGLDFMHRAAIYARYSSDRQSEASIEDQVRLCRERVAREGWALTRAFSDRALSCASMLRPGLQEMLDGAMAGRFDVLVARGA